MNIRYYEDKEVSKVKGWHWIESDTGAWVGPKNDWEMHHNLNIFKYCRNLRTVIQAGGNQGMYPRLLSRIFDQVYTFEPDPLNFKTLVMNCDSDNIFKFQAALGSQQSRCIVNRLTMANVGMHQVSVSKSGVVPMVRASEVVTSNEVDLIMLDLEGYEAEALGGLVKFLVDESKPVVFVERATDQVKQFLSTAGYSHVDTSAMDDIFIAK